MQRLDALHIDQPYIALFGSGNSINALSSAAFEYIKSQAFVITVNYAPIRMTGHLNMWSDRKVSEFLEEHYKTNVKNCLFLAQESRVGGTLKPQVDYFFNRKSEGLRGNYTIVWALQLIKRYFPNKTVLLFGVDMYAPDNKRGKWYDSFTDYDLKKRGNRYQVQTKLNQCAKQLQDFVRHENIINCNPKSQLEVFPKRHWQTLFPIHITHLTNSPLAGAPVHLADIINKYTHSTATSILKKGFGSNSKWSNMAWEYNYEAPSAAELNAEVQKADVVHYHARPYAVDVGTTPTLLQYHSPPRGYVPKKTNSEFNERKLVIAQYHPRFYTDAYIVPNMIDIWDERYMPGDKPTDRIVIFFSWATESGGWSNKGSKQTVDALNNLKKRFGNALDVIVKNNRPYAECMAAKRTAHICIDECATGSYHLQSLEGCAVGALTFNNLDAETNGFMKQVTGQLEHPFEVCPLNELESRLAYFIENQSVLRARGKASREWMEQHWNPEILVGRFMACYFNLMLHGNLTAPSPTVNVPAIPAVAQVPAVPLPAPARPKSKKPVVTFTKNDRPAKAKAKRKVVSPAPPAARAAKPPPVSKPAPPAIAGAGHAFAELHNRHKGEDIYIFGTGPSILNANPDEFKDKVCIGINFACEKIPHINYHFAHVVEVAEALKNAVDPATLVLSETLVHQYYRNPAKRKAAPTGRKPANIAGAYVYPIQNPAEKQLDRKHIQLDKGAAMFTWSTTAHSAIHAAAYMGAKRIYLIGMDYSTFPNGKVHFASRHFPEYAEQDWHALNKHKQGDEWLRNQLLKHHGINVVNLSAQFGKKNKGLVA